MNTIDQVKIRLAKEGGWKAAPSKWSAEEKAKRLGLSLPESEVARMRGMASQALEAAEAPAESDWRKYATPVRDQGNCGSCVAFGVVAAIESQAAMVRDGLLDLSEAYLFFCGCGNCCNRGWQVGPALDFCVEHGLVGEVCFPYQDRDIPCAPCGADALVMVDSWHENYSDRKAWVAANGPVAVAFMVYDDFFDYKGGVYRHVYGDYMGGHCVSLFGYDSEGWLCKNSWGTGWGEEGWFRIAYGECGMDNLYPFWCIDSVSFPEEPPPPPPPPPDGCLNAVARLLSFGRLA